MEVGKNNQPMCQIGKKIFFHPIFMFFSQNGALKSKTKENKNMNK